jgi:hypothetical protein
MKTRVILVLIAIMLSIGSNVIHAVEENNPLESARYMPNDVELYVSMRFNNDYLSELDTLLQRAIENSGEDINFSIRDIFEGIPNFRTALDLFGDWFAVGIVDFQALSNFNTTNPSISDLENLENTGFFVVAKVSDPDVFTNGVRRTERVGDFETWEEQGLTFGIRDNILIMTFETSRIVQDESDSLAEDPIFAEMMGKLPEDTYNIYLYGDSTTFVQSTAPRADIDFNTLQRAQANPADYLGVGMTILEDSTLTLDLVVQSLPNLTNSTTILDSTIMNFIPANSRYALVGNDLTSSIEASIANAPEIGSQLRSLLRLLLIDLDRDILSWMDGGYALFGSFDFAEFVEEATNSRPNFSSFDVDFGLIVEATDPERAEVLARNIGTSISNLTANQPGVSSERETIGEITGRLITLSDRVTGFEIELFIGANDDIFFFGTRSALEDSLDAQGELLESRLYSDMSNYFLPESSQVLFTNDEGVGSLASLISLAALSAEPNPDLNDFTDGFSNSVDIANVITDVFAHTTGSSIFVDGYTITRLTMTVK